jgi:3-methyladenine DNA glycosylase AlkD
MDDPKGMAAEINGRLHSLPVWNTPREREVRREYSQRLKAKEAEFILELARELLFEHDLRTFAYELVRWHPAAFKRVGEKKLEEFGYRMQSWGAVDTFARTLAGPAWLRGQVGDDLIHRWVESPDFWWRRAALVSTVALNVRSQGGMGDTGRTLAVCEKLVGDHEDMVVKALSWALRELVVHDPEAVRKFLDEYEAVLAGRVQREVRSKMETGLKNPRLKSRGPAARGKE